MLSHRTMVGLLMVSAGLRGVDIVLGITTEYVPTERWLAFQLIVLVALAWIVSTIGAMADD